MSNFCTGCSACFAAGEAKIEKDALGFYYADKELYKIKTCPLKCKIKTDSIQQFAIVGITRDNIVWEKSTSGGAFTEICNAYGDDKTIIFGAVWENLTVTHKNVTGVKNIACFRKSKYVQSNMQNCFMETKEFLSLNRKVIFSGTPCQIAGLKCFLDIDYENLLCVDFICHGVCSDTSFKLFTDSHNIKEYEFRCKDKYKQDTIYVSKYLLHTGEIKYVILDDYMQDYIKRKNVNSVCLMCPFSSKIRYSDITIADLKNQKQLNGDIHRDKRNYSVIVFNTNKGAKLLPKLNMFFQPYNMQMLKQTNPLFFGQPSTCF